MQLSVFCPPGQNVDARALFTETEIRRDSTDAISEASVTFYVSDTESAYGVARFGEARFAFRPREWQDIEIRDGSNPTWDESTMTWNEATGTWEAGAGGTRQFAGVITQVEIDSPPGELTLYKCTCADYGILLDRIVINKTWPAGWTDKTIILDAFDGIDAVTVDPDNIHVIANELGALDAKDISLRELLEQICELTGGEWCVDYDRKLHYYTAGSRVAQAVTWDESTQTWEQSTGTWDSQALVLSDAGDGNHRMDSLVRDSARMANRITVLGGFDESGDEITATAQDGESQNKYGILSATIVDRQIADSSTADLRARAEVAQRAWPIESGTLTTWADGLDVGQTVGIHNRAYRISGNYLIRALRIKQIADYCEYEVEFGQRQPDLITELRRTMQRAKQPTYTPVARPAPGSVGVENFANTIEPIRIVNALPALPDAAYGDDAVVLLTTDRKLYRRSGNTWTRNVNAADIEDQIQAGQLAADSVTAGVIAAGAIRATDAVFEAAAIQRADLALAIISTAQIEDAAITNAKIISLSASKLTAGTIDANVITVTNLNASNIAVGTMSGVRLQDGTVADVKIAAGLSASKITTGVLDASTVTVINLNASNITTGLLSAARITAGTMTVTSGTGLFIFDGILRLELTPNGIARNSGAIEMFSDVLGYGYIQASGGFRNGFLQVGGTASIAYAKPGGGSGFINFGQGLYVSHT